MRTRAGLFDIVMWSKDKFCLLLFCIHSVTYVTISGEIESTVLSTSELSQFSLLAKNNRRRTSDFRELAEVENKKKSRY